MEEGGLEYARWEQQLVTNKGVQENQKIADGAKFVNSGMCAYGSHFIEADSF